MSEYRSVVRQLKYTDHERHNALTDRALRHASRQSMSYVRDQTIWPIKGRTNSHEIALRKELHEDE